MRLTRNIILTLLIIVLCSAMAFASDDSPSSEQAPLEVESVPDPWLSLETKTMELRATERTITDVYNILNTGLMSGNNSKLDNIYEAISDCLEFYTDSPLHRYTIADLQGMTWQIANSINNQLTSTNSILGNIYNENYTTNRKLEYIFSAIEDTINIKWYQSGSVLGLSNTLGGSYITSDGYQSGTLYLTFHVNSSDTNSLPGVLRIFVPCINPWSDTTQRNIFDLSVITSGGGLISNDIEVFTSRGGYYVYVYDFYNQQRNDNPNYVLKFSVDRPSYYVYGAGDVYSIPYNTLDYQLIAARRYQMISGKNSNEILSKLTTILQILNSQSGEYSSLLADIASDSEALADYIVSPEKQAAEDASSQVINSTLNNFTGNGSGAAKSSDSNAMKDVSGSIQSGLNGGGSVSGATGVFNSGSDFWGWFTQQNSNYINNPYPAPTVNFTRGSGDEIVDFLTPNSNELQDLLRQGGDQR